MEKKRQKRVTQQNKECNLAMVLICTVATFFFCHLPRLLTSVYEAATFHHQEICTAKKLDYHPLWFLYSIVAMNVLLVVNASSNFCIYLFAGKQFKLNMMKIFSKRPESSPRTIRMTIWKEQSIGNGVTVEHKVKETKSKVLAADMKEVVILNDKSEAVLVNDKNEAVLDNDKSEVVPSKTNFKESPCKNGQSAHDVPEK